MAADQASDSVPFVFIADIFDSLFRVAAIRILGIFPGFENNRN